MLGNCITFAQTAPEKVEGTATFVNPIPMPLGRYVQLADSSVTFIIQKYYASEEPSLQITMFFKFKINRHVPKLEVPAFRAETLAKSKGYVKFKTDQSAIEILSNAISDTLVSEVTVPWSDIRSEKHAISMEALHRRYNRQLVKFTDSSLYRRVPQSNVKLVGFDSNSIILTKPACLKFYSEDGLSGLYFTIDIHYLSDKIERPSYAIVRTANGSFEAVLKGGLEGTDVQGVNVLFFEDVNITPRDMDNLLTEDIIITVYSK